MSGNHCNYYSFGVLLMAVDIKFGGAFYGRKDHHRSQKRHARAAARACSLHRRGRFSDRRHPCGLSAPRRPLRHPAVARLDPAVRTARPKAAGGARAHALRQVHRHAQGRGLLLRQPLLHILQPRRQDEAQPVRRRRRRPQGCQSSCRHAGIVRRSRGGRQQEDLAQDHDAQQRPPEDQRLPRQPRGDRYRRDVACDRHGKGRFQRGQLQRISLPPVRCGAAQHRAHLPL